MRHLKLSESTSGSCHHGDMIQVSSGGILIPPEFICTMPPHIFSVFPGFPACLAHEHSYKDMSLHENHVPFSPGTTLKSQGISQATLIEIVLLFCKKARWHKWLRNRQNYLHWQGCANYWFLRNTFFVLKKCFVNCILSWSQSLAFFTQLTNELPFL